MFHSFKTDTDSTRRATTAGAVFCVGLWFTAVSCGGPAPRPGAGAFMGERVTVSPTDSSDSSSAEPIEAALTSCPTPRADLAPQFNSPVIGEGPFGGWEPCFHYCAPGSFAYGLRLKSEPQQGSSGDDTALNGVKLRCWNPTTGAFTGEVAAAESVWGSYLDYAGCGPWEEPLAGGEMRIEASQGGGDDTSANELIGWCHDVHASSGPLIFPPTFTHWGNLTQTRSCPIGSAVCGVRAKLEAGQGGGDDTALNGVQFRCCNFFL